MTRIEVEARPWSGGFELWNDGECATQCERLENAVQQVRDYLDSIDPGTDHSSREIILRGVLVPEELYVHIMTRIEDLEDALAVLQAEGDAVPFERTAGSHWAAMGTD